jgi:two-component system, chemotaxis family, chemotaxis protein CheY
MAATILVVDDEASVRELLKLHLSAAGYEVLVAADAIAGGYLVLRSPPDLIICDVHMPHMDGFEFISALKADKSIPSMPVIFLTTFEEGDTRGKELGVVGYLTKPIRADRLLSLVARHVAGGAHPIG